MWGFGFGPIGGGGMTMRFEPGEASGLGLVSVDREGVVVAPAGMGHVVGTACQRPAGSLMESYLPAVGGG